MATTQARRLAILSALALAMAATRIHHSLFHHSLDDASWAVFFLAGFWLRGSGRWAFPILMAEAVLIDYLVITGEGIDFLQHYCVSAAYWFLIPSYGALWLAGNWLAKHQRGLSWRTLGLALIALLVGFGICYLISNGSFYWLSPSVPKPRSLGAWVANLSDWVTPFFQTTALYVLFGAMLHVLAVQLSRLGAGSHAQPLR